MPLMQPMKHQRTCKIPMGGPQMPMEMAIWRMSTDGPVRLGMSSLDRESRLEDMLVDDPSLTGVDLLVLGRQVPTAYGGFIDVLALDVEGRVHVLELKRDRTPREVVAQILDYGSWCQGLNAAALEDIFESFHPDGDGLEVAFQKHFDALLPDAINTQQQLTVMASELDPASDRIVQFLSDSYSVPINAVFFRHFHDDGREYLARTWLIDPAESEAKSSRGGRSKLRPWNGRDFYVVLGRADDPERWSIARRFGLLSAGGGEWYWKPLRNLSEGKRVFAYVGGVGYVGVGTVTGVVVPAREVTVTVDGVQQPLIDQPGLSDRFVAWSQNHDPETTEMVVPVSWTVALEPEAAISEPGLFASRVTACKLRDDHTIEVLEEHFNL